MPPLNKVLLLPIPPPPPQEFFPRNKGIHGYTCTIVQCFISLFYNLLVGVKNIPNCRQIESSCGECIQNIDPPCSWCEDTVSTLCFFSQFVDFILDVGQFFNSYNLFVAVVPFPLQMIQFSDKRKLLFFFSQSQ